tara:strand:- start:531 stop:1172 length:642 start_codon:yes stop_codon:yes gene_type:complete
MRSRWKCEATVFMGDILDWHSISFHASEPSAAGPLDEHTQALEAVKRWHTTFPNSTVTIGNHDARVTRLAATVNIPARFLKEYSDIWQTPTWQWVHEYQREGVRYFHGVGSGGKQPALNAARASMVSTCAGHYHSCSGVSWTSSSRVRLFGLDAGCGVDIDHPAMRYGSALLKKPMLGCGVVLDGQEAHWCPMDIQRGGKYHRARFKKKVRRK